MIAWFRSAGFRAWMGAPLLLAAACGWAEKPDRERFLRAVGNTSITVFPACVRAGNAGSHDPGAAAKIAAGLNAAGVGQAKASDGRVPLPEGWHRNQARMFRESGEALGRYVRAHGLDTEYALLPEYLIGGRGTAFGVLLNSHWKQFRKAKPKSPADCTEVLLQVLREDLRRNPGP
jgi:hypothetical protein